MKDVYTLAEMEVIRFKAEDIITDSEEDNGEDEDETGRA